MTECADAGLALDGSMGNNNRGEGRIYRYGGGWSRLKMRKQEWCRRFGEGCTILSCRGLQEGLDQTVGPPDPEKRPTWGLQSWFEREPSWCDCVSLFKHSQLPGNRSSRVWEWMVGRLHGFKHGEGFWVQWVTFCLLPFPYLVSLGQAACSLVLEGVLFCSSCALDPTSPFSYLLGGWCCHTFTPLPSAFCVAGYKRAEPTQECGPALGTWEVLCSCCVHTVLRPAGAAALVLSQASFLSPLSCWRAVSDEGRPRTGDTGTEACVQSVSKRCSPLAWLFSVSVILQKIFFCLKFPNSLFSDQ